MFSINPKTETEKIVSFIRSVLKKQGFRNVVLGLSGGLDSAVCFSLLQKAIPPKHIFPYHLYYFPETKKLTETILKAIPVPQKNQTTLSIAPFVDEYKKILNVQETIRLGNIMARVRMTILFDQAKKHNALVCGTENKSEHYLGYFTRFGDAASDFEPIRHLYKSHIHALAEYLNIPQEIRSAPASAHLWQGQTDEGEFGFTYAEAGEVIHAFIDKKIPTEEILKLNFKNAEKIIERIKQNTYKHTTPYHL